MRRDCAKAPPRTHRKYIAWRAPLAAIVLAAFAVFFSALPGLHAAQNTPGTAKIASIKFTGSKRFADEELARSIGLTPGTVVTREEIQAGAAKLAKIGWFDQVNYKFQSTAKGVDIEFSLVDAPTAPVWFDNFPWFSDAELTAAIRSAGVLYDGSAPESGAVLDSIREALAALLKSHNIAGEVEGEMIQSPEGEGSVERFRVLASDLTVTSLEFSDPAAQNDPAISALKDTIVGKAYSRYQLALFLAGQVRPRYTSKGYLRVKFGEPVALFAGDPSKPLSKEITIKVKIEPGALYHWGGASWSGQTAMDGATLAGFLQIKSGDPADAQRIADGWERILKEYGKRGYIEAKVQPTPQFNDADARVEYTVHITEGTQYRMGQLILTGLSLDAEHKLLPNWKIARGDVFDSSFVEDFVNGGAKKVFQDTPVHFSRVGHLLRPNPETKTVDVLLDFQ